MTEEQESWADELRGFIRRLPADMRRAVAAELESELEPLIRRRMQAVAEIKSAVPLTQEEQSALRESLERRFGEAFFLSLKVDPAVIGGLVVEVKGHVIDASVGGKLEALREYLLSFEEGEE